jgi:hypothetical protein
VEANAVKWRYAITYGKMKPGLTLQQIEKEMEKYKTDVEKTGVKVVLWGHPFGVSENIMAVFDVGGKMDEYIKVVGLSPPYTDSRTDFVLEH